MNFSSKNYLQFKCNFLDIMSQNQQMRVVQVSGNSDTFSEQFFKTSGIISNPNIFSSKTTTDDPYWCPPSSTTHEVIDLTKTSPSKSIPKPMKLVQMPMIETVLKSQMNNLRKVET